MNVIFKIETSNGIESYFLENFTDEKDIHNELSDYGYCDVYEIIDIQEVKNDYMIERYRVAYEWLEEIKTELDNALFDLKVAAQNQYNKDYYRVLYNV